MLSRREIGQMNETALLLAADGARYRLSEDWRRGRPGKIADLYDLALVYGEFVMRGLPCPAPLLPDQLVLERLFDD